MFILLRSCKQLLISLHLFMQIYLEGTAKSATITPLKINR